MRFGENIIQRPRNCNRLKEEERNFAEWQITYSLKVRRAHDYDCDDVTHALCLCVCVCVRELQSIYHRRERRK